MSGEFMFTADQQTLIREITTKLSPEQQSWLGGYLTGLSIHPQIAQEELLTASPIEEPPPVGEKIKVLYGSRTGNSKGIASRMLNHASSLGISAELVDMNDYNVKELKKEKFLYIVVSTDGEGDPPVSAEELYEFIHSERAPRLEQLNYSVLALGDSSYKHFCKIGRDIDNRLEQLGAIRLSDRVDCDLDFEDASLEWYRLVLEKFQKIVGFSQTSHSAGDSSEQSTEIVPHTRKNPYRSTILDKFVLNGRGSGKEVMHLELSIDESEIKFNPGDSVGIISPNPEDLADGILEKAKIRPDSLVTIDKEEKTIRVALMDDLEITCITRQVLEKYSRYLLDDKLNIVLEEEDGLDDFIYGRDFLDILNEYPSIISANELSGVLRKLPPRVYSIASSQQYNEDEIHLTVGVVRYNRENRDRLGACSSYLSDKRKIGDDVNIYIDPNEGFRLPEDPSTPIIMIGPGTGVAPFRSFLQEREQSEVRGKSWLFFGDRNFTTDFLYQTDMLKFKKKGTLTKLDVAFSRDQDEKVYVQHKMMAQSREFYEWINQGAHIYICGDKKRMAVDVQESLLSIIETEGGITRERAEVTLKELRKSRRLQEDVY